jgi:hypothetical protein
MRAAYLAELAEMLLAAIREIRDLEKLPTAVDELDLEANADIYEEALKCVRRERRRKSSRGPFCAMPDVAFDIVPTFTDPTVSEMRRNTRMSRRDELVRARETAISALQRTDAEIARLREDLESLAAPEWLPLGWAVLTTFSILGLALPVGIMVAGPKDLSLNVRLLVGCAFGAGLVALLWFLWTVMRIEGVSPTRALTSALRSVRKKKTMKAPET